MIDISDEYSFDEKVISIRSRCVQIYEYMNDNKASLRMVEENLGIPKSTAHAYIHTYIKTYFPNCYGTLRRILLYNKLYHNKPRKYW